MWKIVFFLTCFVNCFCEDPEEIYHLVEDVVWHFDASSQSMEIEAPHILTVYAKQLSVGIGTILQQYCYHMLHFPGMRDVGIHIGERLGATPIPNDYFHCDVGRVQESPTRLDTVGVWINGLNTNLKDTIEAAEFISKACGDIKVYYAYNSTSGLMADIWEHLTGKLFFPTAALEVALKAIQSAIKEAGPTGKVVIFAHSQGGAILERALQYLSREEKKLLCIYTFGSAALFFNYPDIPIQHILSDRDWIPFLADPVRFVIAQKWAPHLILLKHGPTWGTFVNHAILGGTYQAEILSIGKSLNQ
jgi:hypothetical protein